MFLSNNNYQPNNGKGKSPGAQMLPWRQALVRTIWFAVELEDQNMSLLEEVKIEKYCGCHNRGRSRLLDIGLLDIG